MSALCSWASRRTSSVICLFGGTVLLLLHRLSLYDSQQQQQLVDSAALTAYFATSNNIRRIVSENVSAQETNNRNLLLDIALPPRSGTGIYFDKRSNLLYVTQTKHHRIIVVDPDDGKIAENINVGGFPDDLTVAPDGTLYWTDFLLGTIYKRSPNQDGDSKIQRLYQKFTYPLLNGITVTEDGKRLLFSQCFNPFGNAVMERDFKEETTTAIERGVPLCASNGMDSHGNALYATRTFEGCVVKIDIASSQKEKDKDANRTVSDVTKAIRFPHQVKFDSQGNLWGIDFPDQIVQIDYKSDDAHNNVNLYAKAPGILDSLAFDKHDRLYVAGDNKLWEVESKNRFRFVTKI